MSERHPHRADPPIPDDFKTCPFCKEQIRIKAVKCRFCGEWLEKPAESVVAPLSNNDGESLSVPALIPPPSLGADLATTTPKPQSFLFAKIYACMCFIGCIFAVYFGFVAALKIVRAGDWLHNAATQRSSGQLLAVVLMFTLWAATGVAIMRRKRSAITLTYIVAVVAGLGILARGIVPLDMLLAIPTFVIIPYLRERSAMLTRPGTGNSSRETIALGDDGRISSVQEVKASPPHDASTRNIDHPKNVVTTAAPSESKNALGELKQWFDKHKPDSPAKTPDQVPVQSASDTSESRNISARRSKPSNHLMTPKAFRGLMLFLAVVLFIGLSFDLRWAMFASGICLVCWERSLKREKLAESQFRSDALPPSDSRPSIVRLFRRRKIWGLVVLAFACGVMVFTLKDVTSGEVLGQAIGQTLIYSLLMGALLSRGFDKRNGTALLVFSAVCAVVSLIYAYNFRVGVEKGRQRNLETSRRMTANIIEMAQQATNGLVPNIKPTGDAEKDAAFQPLNDFLKETFGSLQRMETEIAATEPQGVYSLSVIGSRLSLELEIGKRNQSRIIIESHRDTIPAAIDAARKAFSALRVSDRARQGAIRGFENTVRDQTPNFDEMFSLRLRREKAEAEFLQFMFRTFDNYHVTTNSISFKNPLDSKEYAELTDEIDASVKQAEAFQERQRKAHEEGMKKIQTLVK